MFLGGGDRRRVKEVLKTTYLQMFAQPERTLRPPRDGLTVVHIKKPTVGFYRNLYDAVGRDYDWTSRITPNGLNGWESPGSFLVTAILQRVLRLSCGTCSTIRGTPNGRQRSESRCDKKTAHELPATLWKGYSKLPALLPPGANS
jgi:hypothetical protein